MQWEIYVFVEVHSIYVLALYIKLKLLLKVPKEVVYNK